MTNETDLKVAGLDEAVKNIKDDIKSLQESLRNYPTNDTLNEKVKNLKEDFTALAATLKEYKEKSVDISDFNHIRNIVFGFISMILSAVGYFFVKIVLKQ
jgi:peptidoglycan hydrolase CwlO-like protein